MADRSLFALEFPAPDIALVSINDPQKGANVLSQPALAELERLLDEVAARGNVAGLIFRSEKPGMFIAGADLREFAAQLDAPDDEVVKIARHGQQLFGRLAKIDCVTVAAIDGLCLGGGSELAIWCDRRIMTTHPKSSFAFPEVKLGLFPGWGGTARTPRIAGLSNAVELVTGGEGIDAREAWAMGLVSDVVEAAAPDRGGDDDPLLAAAIRLVRAEQESGDYLRDRQRWSEPLTISEGELGFLGATASAYIQQQTGGHYPAPLAALEVMLGASQVDVETACQMEAEAFARLFGSEVNRALLNVFFLQDANKKQSGVEGDVQPRPIERAAIVGAGVMGQGIAAANVKRGVPVVLADVAQAAVARGVQGVLREASYNRRLKGPDVDKALKITPLIQATVSDAEVASTDIVIEAIIEEAAAKRDLYARLEPQLSEQAILCTNTSTIPVSDLARDLKRPENFCGLHFFNPVRRMPLVEVIRGAATSDATIATAVAYARQIGKSPIVCGDGPGFIVNRILLPYMNEALLLLEEGAQIGAIDRAAKAFGMPMGPIALYDTVGLDVALHAGGVMERAFGDRVEGSAILPAMVERGLLGQKSGEGFFVHGNARKKGRPQPGPAASEVLAACRRGEQEFTAEQLTDRLLLPMFLEATRVVEEGVARSVEDVDLALIYGIGFPPFRGGLFFWADTVGVESLRERLRQYEPVGARYRATDWLEERAKSGQSFYSRPPRSAC